ncbi:UNVERIFIED_CONTAM: hypothetical protein FKN15_063336 [Acipenser sinensis]
MLHISSTGDNGYPLKPWLLTPSLKLHQPADTAYDEAHCTTKNVIERAFEILKACFKCLSLDNGLLKYTPTKSAKITMVWAMLHNWAIHRNMPLDDNDDQGVDVIDHVDCAYYANIPDVGGETAEMCKMQGQQGGV